MPSSRLFRSGYAANHKRFLKRESRCFQNIGKKCVDSGGEYVEGWHVQVSVRQLWFKKKISPCYIWTTLYIQQYFCDCWWRLVCQVLSVFRPRGSKIYRIKHDVQVFWDTMLSCWVSASQHLRGAQCLQNVMIHWLSDTALHPKRPESSATPMWEPSVLHNKAC